MLHSIVGDMPKDLIYHPVDPLHMPQAEGRGDVLRLDMKGCRHGFVDRQTIVERGVGHE